MNKLYLDDLRKPPEGFELATNFKDCIFKLSIKDYQFISLDYSLGERFTGLDVLKWMVENKQFPEKLNIHSTLDFGRSAMAAFIRDHFPKGYQYTMNSI